jgi:hypothetical protein
MAGSNKTLQRNNRECKETFIGPSMAPRFSSPRHSFTFLLHTGLKRDLAPAQILRRWQAEIPA